MEWCRLAVKCLIDAYKEETCLYNAKSPNYNNHARKEAAVLKYIRRSTAAADIITKMKSLHTSFVTKEI